MAVRNEYEAIAAKVLYGSGVATSRDLVAAGIPYMEIGRLVEKKVISKQSRGFYTLDSDYSGDLMPLIAARFGGEPGRIRGVVCLQMAAHLHGLTDLDRYQIKSPEVALHASAHVSRAEIPVRMLRLGDLYELSDVQWTIFSGQGIHVTQPERTVCDLFSPWSGKLAEGMANEALSRLMHDDFKASQRAVARASFLGWGTAITNSFESMRAHRKFSEIDADEGGLRL